MGAAEVRAEAGAVYRWETADGTVSFTDDAKRVPERYQATVETVDRGMLTEYGRYTATDRDAHDDAAERLATRLDALRAANAEDEADSELEGGVEVAPVQRSTSGPQVRDTARRIVTRMDGSVVKRSNGRPRYRTYDYGDSTSNQSLPVDPNDPSPVITERLHVRVSGQPMTQPMTVTRQGDRVLSIVKERSHYHTLDFPEFSELEDANR